MLIRASCSNTIVHIQTCTDLTCKTVRCMDYVSYKGTAEHTKIYACVTHIMRQRLFVWLFLWAGNSWVGWPTSGCSLLLDPVGFRMDFETIQPKNRRRIWLYLCIEAHPNIFLPSTFPPYFHSLSVPLLSLLLVPSPPPPSTRYFAGSDC